MAEIRTQLEYNEGLALALGFFDGCHLGHKAVINSAIESARLCNTKSAIITFKEHPCVYFKWFSPQYISFNRVEMLQNIGVDYVYLLDFDEYISKLNAESYFRDIIWRNFKPLSISTGFNHTFGANKSGNPLVLSNLANEYGFEYYESSPIELDGEVVSSTLIRLALIEGNIERANKFLGYEFFISGIVQEGNKIGRSIGFPTANIIYPQNLVNIPFGVYFVDVIINDFKYAGVLNYGIKPTITTFSNKTEPILEVHIFDFNKDIYGEEIFVYFKKMIRREKKFSSLTELSNQINEDKKRCLGL